MAQRGDAQTSTLFSAFTVSAPRKLMFFIGGPQFLLNEQMHKKKNVLLSIMRINFKTIVTKKLGRKK